MKVKDRSKLIGDTMDAIAVIFDREGVSEGEGIATVLTIAGALIACESSSPRHLERGCKLADAHIRNVAKAWMDDPKSFLEQGNTQGLRNWLQ